MQIVLSSYTVTTAAGCGNDENFSSLKLARTGLTPNDFMDSELHTWIGRVNDIEAQILPQKLQAYQCRNNQLAYLALQHDGFIAHVLKAKSTYGADKIGVFLGTSTSGILTTELAYKNLHQADFNLADRVNFRQQHNSFSVADFVQNYFQLCGPVQVISTACSSSAKVFATASRYIQAGLCEAAIVGGVDSLCFTTLYGFNSLELVSPEICRPADINRKGLSLGEGAAFALLEKKSHCHISDPVYLMGYGESSDAYHMSSPDPEARGAIKAMQAALANANLDASQIDYINLHGTATAANDTMEDKAVTAVFSSQTPCSSTKGWTGHTLGASGAIEAIYSALCIRNSDPTTGFIPQSINTQVLAPDLSANVILQADSSPVRYVASNSFGFGGTNCCLIFGSTDERDYCSSHSKKYGRKYENNTGDTH
jgi:3-oxoacyl-[acyl-carrier-protein] synthase-1